MIRQAVRHIAWAVLGLSLVAWGASYLRIDWVEVPGSYGVLLDDGAVYLSPGATLVVQRDLGAGIQQVASVRAFSRHHVVLPLWLSSAAAVVALWGVWRFGFEQRQRALAGCCPVCRYDLTGIDGVCPECGGER